MAGLDNIKGYAEGESVEPATTPAVPATVKPVAAKGPYSLGTPTGLGAVDPSLLTRMEQLVQEREARRGGFMESMRDAQAWWSGGAAGPSEGLAKRAAEKEGFDATTFGMRRDIAQYKQAQKRAEAMGGMLFGTPAASTTTQTPQSNAGAAPGANAPAAAAPGTPVVPQGGIIGLVRDPDLRASISAQARMDPDAAFKSVQTYLAKNAEDPVMVKELKYMIDNKLIDPRMIPAAVLTKFAGSGAFVPHDVRGVGGTTQSTPIGTAGGMSPQGGAPTTVGGAPRPGPMAPPAAPMAPPAAPAAAPMAPPATTQPRPAAPVAAPMAPPAAPVNPQMQAPLVSPTLQTGFAPGSKEDLDAKAEAAKQQIAARMEQEKPVQKAAGESAVQLQSLASSAKNNITEYDMAENILKKYPKAFGIAQDGSATAAVIQLVKPGTTIPILGIVKSEGIEEAIAQKSLPKKAIEARNIFNSIATRQGVEFAKNNLTGEGRGTLSNADMKMAGVAKGLSVDSPAAANLIFTVLNRENEMMTLQRNNAWQKYQEQARAAGAPADFNRFRETPEYKNAMEEKDARVRKRFPEFFKNEEAPEVSATPGTKKYNPKTRKVE